jgi:hypothetical protein
LSLLRKAIWPAAIALGFLVFLGAIGVSQTRPAFADTNDICLGEEDEDSGALVDTVQGPTVISEGQTANYWIIIEGPEGNPPDADQGTVISDVDIVDLNNEDGDSNITSVADGGDFEGADHTTINIPPTDIVDDLVVYAYGSNVCGSTDDELKEMLIEFLDTDIAICLETDSCIDSVWKTNGGDEDDNLGKIGLTPGDIAEWIGEWIWDETGGSPGWSCEDLADDLEKYLIKLGLDEYEANQIAQDVESLCGDTSEGDSNANDACDPDVDGSDDDPVEGEDYAICDWDTWDFDGEDAYALVDVTCDDAGVFDLSFADSGLNPESAQIEVTCVGEVDEGVITATPTKVEIVPAMGSVSQSLIVVNLLDADGNPVEEGVNVTFTTTLCEFDDEDGLTGVLDLDELKDVLDIFDDYDGNDAESAEEITEWFNEVYNPEDPDDESNDVEAVTLDDDAGAFDEDDTIAAIILNCDDEDIKPGIAEVCFDINLEDQDVDGCVKVTVVGPPAKVTAAAAPASVICGEKATISVEVLDAANQPVSDHTRVEAVTNIGGVLAGTGAVAGQAGLVTPVSSTVAETFNGKATLYLVTSDAHTGPYEVVLASGGSGSVNTGLGGVFSTPPQVTQVTVACTQPAATAAPAAPAPTVTAPRTGTGVTIAPPNTGDAGLADSSGSSWALIAVAGVVAFSVAGLATLKLSRR